MNKMLKKALAVFLCIWMLCLTGITVGAADEQPYESPASIKLSKTSVAMLYGETTQLTATVLPEGASQRVTWSSSNPNLVAVENGKLTAAADTAETPSGKQTATITVVSVSVPRVKATCTVTVDNAPPTKLESFISLLQSLLASLVGAFSGPAKEFGAAFIEFLKKLVDALPKAE